MDKPDLCEYASGAGEELTGHKLFNKRIDLLVTTHPDGSATNRLPTISTRKGPFAPVLAVQLLDERAPLWDSGPNRSLFQYTRLLKTLLDGIECGEIQSHRHLMGGARMASKATKKDIRGVLFDLLYGVLQLYSYWRDTRYADLFGIVSGIVYSAGEQVRFRGFDQHVDHFKIHAAVFLSAGDKSQEWRDVLDRSVALLEEWGDQLPPESILIHAAHNLFIQCASLPESDSTYDLIKGLRRQRLDEAISDEEVFETLNETVGFMEAYGILKILWEGMAEKYYVHVRRTVDDKANENDAIDYVSRIKFSSPLGTPYLRTQNGNFGADNIIVSFPGGTAIGKTCTLVKYRGTRIIIDYGCDTYGKLPRWSPDLDLLDHVFITHAHQDHVGGLLHLYKKHGYKGKWHALPESKDLIALSLRDSVKISIEELGEDAPFSEADVEYVVSQFEPIPEKVEFGFSHELSIKAFPAGHVHGSCQYLINSPAGSLYLTGDFNPRFCRSAKSLELPALLELQHIKAVVTEGTYAFTDGEIISANKAKEELLGKISRARSFPILIPVLSLGRAQEVLSALSTEPYSVGVFGLAKEMTMACGFTYPGNIEFVNRRLQSVGPKDYDILVASAGCLQGGPSRYFFDTFKPIYTILTGFLFPGTLGKFLSGELDKVRYSAHATHQDLVEFLNNFPNAKRYLIHYSGPRNIPAGVDFFIPKINAEYEV